MRLFTWGNLVLIIVFILGTLGGMALDNKPQEDLSTIMIDHSTGEITTIESDIQTHVVSDVSQKQDKHLLQRLLETGPTEKPSPQDWIKENEISVTNDKVIIKINNPEWARFTNTNSMDPIIDEDSHAIEIVPTSPEQVQPGDIVSYKSNYVDGFIIHRVVETGYDSKGWYAIFKGDNNESNDPEKVRFSQIKRVVVAIIY